MNVISFLRHLVGKAEKKPPVEFIREYTVEAPVIRHAPAASPAATAQVSQAPETASIGSPPEDIAFSPHGDLEAYVHDLNISSGVIEDWISAGVLLPEETRVASKMILIMHRKNRNFTN